MIHDPRCSCVGVRFISGGSEKNRHNFRTLTLHGLTCGVAGS